MGELCEKFEHEGWDPHYHRNGDTYWARLMEGSVK